MTKKNLIWIFIFTLACSFQDVTAKHLLDCHEKWSYMPYFLVLANYLNLSSHFDFHLLWIPERTVSYLTHHCRLWKNKICSFDCLFLSLQITGKKFIYNARYNMPMTLRKTDLLLSLRQILCMISDSVYDKPPTHIKQIAVIPHQEEYKYI